MPKGRKKEVEETSTEVEAPEVEPPEDNIPPDGEPTPESPVAESPEVPVEEVPAEVEALVEAEAETSTEAPVEAPELEHEVILPELEVTERALPFGGMTLEVLAPDNCVYELKNLPGQYRGQLPQQYQ